MTTTTEAIDLSAPQSMIVAEAMLDAGYNYLERLERELRHRRIYLSDSGRKRFHHIVGWLQGVNDSGACKTALRLAEELATNLHYLVWERNVEVAVPARDCFAEHNASVPANKVVLSDDGTLHSFSFAVYTPHHDQAMLYSEMSRLLGIGHDYRGAERELSQYGVCTTVELNAERYDRNLTEDVYCPGRSMSEHIYYRRSYVGGVIFHRGKLSPTNGSWSCHT